MDAQTILWTIALAVGVGFAVLVLYLRDKKLKREGKTQKQIVAASEKSVSEGRDLIGALIGGMLMLGSVGGYATGDWSLLKTVIVFVLGGLMVAGFVKGVLDGRKVQQRG